MVKPLRILLFLSFCGGAFAQLANAPAPAPAVEYPFTDSAEKPSFSHSETPDAESTPPASESTQRAADPTETAADPVMEKLNEEYSRETPASEANAPKKIVSPTDSTFLLALRALGALAIVCALVLFGGKLMRRYGKNNPLLAGAQLGALLGKLYLSPKAALYFVRTNNRVLVIGVHTGSISLVADFPANEFDAHYNAAESPAAKEASPFVGKLRAALADIQKVSPTPKPTAPVDDELDALRHDVQRLQRYLEDNGRDKTE